MKKAIQDFLISFATFTIAMFIQWGCVQLGFIDFNNFFNVYLSLGVSYVVTSILVHITIFVVKNKKKKSKE